MKLNKLKEEVKKYQYFEDDQVIDVCLASIIATRLKLGDPVWLTVIGASSGGKSQILRPLSLTDGKFLHRVDDLTENTFLSGAKVKEGEPSPSLLKRIGKHGMLVMSDLTVLFSKSSEARTAILSQFRMLYDGEMIKYSGNSGTPLQWEGYLGVLAGSTPTLYSFFEEVADMGQRFIYYRMKEYDGKKATHLALDRTLFGKELDEKLGDMYKEYIVGVVQHEMEESVVLDKEVKDRLVEVAHFAERVRTAVQTDFKGEKIVRVPVPAMPIRVALQLMTIAKGLAVMRHYDTGSFKLEEEDLASLDWCAYSLGNEEKRVCLKILASIPCDDSLTTASVADELGLATSVTGLILQNLSAVGVVTRIGVGEALEWKIRDNVDWKIVRRIEGITSEKTVQNREIGFEEMEEF